MSGKTIIPKEYKQTDVGLIPEDWKYKPLEGLVAIHHGFGFRSQYFCSHGQYRLTTPGNFYESGGFREVGDKQKYYIGPLPEGFLLSKGDLILAMTEQATGLLGSAAILPESGTFLHNQRLGRVQVLTDEVSSRFLFWLFNSTVYRNKVRETAAGTKVKHTSPSKLLEIHVALPPTKVEQEAIATALSDADALIESLERLIAKKRDIKQAAMQQLLTGQTRLPGFISTNGFKQSEVGVIPNDWLICALGELAKLKSGESITNSSIDQASAFPCYGGNGLRGYTSRYTHDGIYALIGRQGALCGNVQLVSGKFYASEHAIVVTPQDKVDIRWLFYILKYMNLNRYSESSAQPGLSVGKLSSLSIPTPSTKDEQTAVAEVISDMDAEIAALEVRRDKTKLLKQGMMQELLTGRIRLV